MTLDTLAIYERLKAADLPDSALGRLRSFFGFLWRRGS
jgi:hypothetical protein